MEIGKGKLVGGAFGDAGRCPRDRVKLTLALMPGNRFLLLVWICDN